MPHPLLLLALLAGLLALPARAQAPAEAGGAAGEPVEVKLWHSYRGQEREALEALVTRYDEARPEVRVVSLALPSDSFGTKLESAAPRGNGPDLFIAAHERIGAWSRTGLVAPVPAAAAEGLHETTVAAMTYEEALYGLPLAYKCLALFWNTSLLEAAPRSTDEILALQRGGPEAMGHARYALAYSATEPYFHAPWMHGFGGGVFAPGPDGAVQLDAPQNAAAMAFAKDLFDAGVVPGEPTGALVTQLFNEGLAATVINGPWFLGELDPSVPFAVSPLPVVSATGDRAAPFLTVEGAFVSGFAAEPEAALELARWLVAPEQALERAVAGRQAVATLAAARDPLVAGDPILDAFRAQLDSTVPLPNRPEMAATWEPLAKAIRRVTRGALSPEAAAAAAQTEYDIVTRPPPPAVSPAPYLVMLGLFVAGLVAWLAWQGWSARERIREHGFAYLYVGPAALAMGLLVVVPFVVGAAVSLFAHRDGDFTFVGMANFVDIVLARDWPLTSPQSFYFTLVVTVLWTGANLALHVGIGMALAMVLREPWLRLRGVYRVLLIVPWAVPNYITALIWKGMFHQQFGAINGLLVSLGLKPVSWFSQFSTAFAANLITNTWLGFPFMMVVTLGALQAIPRDLEQAAEVDGATGWQRFRHVTLPLLKPALLPAVVLGSVWTFNMFNIIYLVSGGEPDGGTEILISEAYRWAFTRGHRYGYAAAYAVLIFLVLLGWSRAGNKLAGAKVL